MPKLLTQIWKTIHGQFFETEEEAIRAEQKYIIKKILIDVRKETMQPVIAEYEVKKAAWERDQRKGPGPGPNPEWEGYHTPPGFTDLLVEKLFEVAEFKMENKDK